MNYTISSLVSKAEVLEIPLWEVIIRGEMETFGGTEEKILERMDHRYSIMEESASKAMKTSLNTMGNLITGCTMDAKRYTDSGRTICGSFINRVMVHALSCSEVNASMGRICACPTAGACGIVPAVLVTMREEFNIPRKRVVEALIIASGFGAAVMENATVAGAEGGCQAECGVAAAMGAAAAAYLMGGSNDVCVNAFSIAIMNVMGLVCDPVAGLVQIPCAQRNASQAVNALISADLALGGMECPIPPDEVVDAMYNVGQMLPIQLRETALGGIAATNTAKAIEHRLFSDK